MAVDAIKTCAHWANDVGDLHSKGSNLAPISSSSPQLAQYSIKFISCIINILLNTLSSPFQNS
jgi:hypothetical protein